MENISLWMIKNVSRFLCLTTLPEQMDLLDITYWMSNSSFFLKLIFLEETGYIFSLAARILLCALFPQTAIYTFDIPIVKHWFEEEKTQPENESIVFFDLVRPTPLTRALLIKLLLLISGLVNHQKFVIWSQRCNCWKSWNLILPSVITHTSRIDHIWTISIKNMWVFGDVYFFFPLLCWVLLEGFSGGEGKGKKIIFYLISISFEIKFWKIIRFPP